MSKADKMLAEMGFRLSEYGLHSVDGHYHLWKKDWHYITIWRNAKAVSTNLPVIDFELWVVLNEKMKELGWF